MSIFGGKKSAMKKWVAAKALELEQETRPTDYPQVHSDGPDADRVLVFGTGAAVGWGATSYSKALPGALADVLTELTTRGTDVDVLPFVQLQAASARSAIAGAKLWRFDVIVVSIGFWDALMLTDVGEYRAALDVLFADMTHAALPSARIVVLGIPPVGSLPGFDGRNAEEADEHAAQLDAVAIEAVADLTQVNFLALRSGAADYPQLATEIADSILDDLNAAREGSVGALRGPSGQGAAERERERVEGVKSVGLMGTAREERFDRIVAMARQLYGTSGATFAVVDDENVWHKAGSDGLPLQLAKSESMCSTTILGRGAHVEADIQRSNGPDDSRVAGELGVRFYAGYPVESPSGEQIGALCIFDTKPREEHFDDTMLRQLALLIQAELQVDALHSN